jgi:pimeloyl-ACP methyl ester carboxylesterase
MNILKANGIELAFDCFGDETDEAILLISSLGTQMIRWTVPFCQDLATRGYRVIRFDNRDAGRSTHFSQCAALDFPSLVTMLRAGQRPDVPYTLYDMANDAVGMLDALSIAQAHVVGQSMGGVIAQIVTCESPERVLSLTSIMSSTGNPTLPQTAPDLMTMMTRPAPNPVLDEGGFLAHSLAFERRIAGTGYPFDEEHQRTLILEEVQRAYDPSGAARQLAAVAIAGDRRQRLATIRVPTLVIHGAQDPLVLPACGRDTALSIPDAEFMLIDGMGHYLPPAVYRTVADAIDRTAARASKVWQHRDTCVGPRG